MGTNIEQSKQKTDRKEIAREKIFELGDQYQGPEWKKLYNAEASLDEKPDQRWNTFKNALNALEQNLVDIWSKKQGANDTWNSNWFAVVESMPDAKIALEEAKERDDAVKKEAKEKEIAQRTTDATKTMLSGMKSFDAMEEGEITEASISAWRKAYPMFNNPKNYKLSELEECAKSVTSALKENQEILEKNSAEVNLEEGITALDTESAENENKRDETPVFTINEREIAEAVESLESIKRPQSDWEKLRSETEDYLDNIESNPVRDVSEYENMITADTNFNNFPLQQEVDNLRMQRSRFSERKAILTKRRDRLIQDARNNAKRESELKVWNGRGVNRQIEDYTDELESELKDSPAMAKRRTKRLRELQQRAGRRITNEQLADIVEEFVQIRYKNDDPIIGPEQIPELDPPLDDISKRFSDAISLRDKVLYKLKIKKSQLES